MHISALNFKGVCSKCSDFLDRSSASPSTRAKKRRVEEPELQLEPWAVTLYSEVTGHQIFPLWVCAESKCPTPTIFPTLPFPPPTHLGCTPDRRVTDLNADLCHGLLEIKCPNNDSYRSCPYLIRREDGSYSLKHGNEYNYQITGQMWVDRSRVV